MNLKERVKKAVNTDNILDLIVDMSLILFDVLSSPILIVLLGLVLMRLMLVMKQHIHLLLISLIEKMVKELNVVMQH